MRLLLDEMYASAVAVELRARGHDVLSVHEADPVLGGASDAKVLSAAVSAERVLVTENVRDFRPLEIAILEGSDACFAPVLGLTEASTHPHMAHRKSFVELDGVLQPAMRPNSTTSGETLSSASMVTRTIGGIA